MRILLAEDDLSTRRLLQVRLERWGYEVEAVGDGLEAWERLSRSGAPPLVLLDWLMPGLDGLEVCRHLRAAEADEAATSHVILMSCLPGHLEQTAAIEAGADDFLAKPFDMAHLRLRLRLGQRLVELSTGLMAAEAALQNHVTHDDLTGILNRAAILNLLETELSRARRQDTGLGVLMVDLDHFKAVNDSHGHLAGDAVLREVAARMAHGIRCYDHLGRYGGEEFLVVLPGCDLAETTALAERLCLASAEAPVETVEATLTVTLSIGATSLPPADPALMEDLIRAADRALYHAKRTGRNRATARALSAPVEDGGYGRACRVA